MESPREVALSALIEQLAGERGERDQLFVRSFSRWLSDRATYLRLSIVERLGLVDVVVTFQMKGRVRMVITGYPPDELPGEVTVAVDERDFPFVVVRIAEEPSASPYEICTMDYGPAGRRIRVQSGPRAGQEGVLVVAATIGARQENRVTLDSGETVTLSGEVLTFAT